VDADYRKALKRSILNYVLLDKEEQQRLEMPVVAKVHIIS